MSDRDQQDECPKAFYCLPESCGDCPDQQLPCEGCPDPGMPCLGCPAVDEQATTEGMWFHLQHARWQMNPSSLRDQIDHAIRAKFGQNEVPGVSPMPPRTFAEGERAATERHSEAVEQWACDFTAVAPVGPGRWIPAVAVPVLARWIREGRA